MAGKAGFEPRRKRMLICCLDFFNAEFSLKQSETTEAVEQLHSVPELLNWTGEGEQLAVKREWVYLSYLYLH